MIQTFARGLVRVVPAASLVACLLASGAATAALPPRVQQVLASQSIPASAVSIVVRDAVSGEQHLAWNQNLPRTPASTIKVLTTYAALDVLGPAYTWKTRAYAAGPVVDGRLQGDLVIEGGGDPFITAERWWRFARELRQRGIESIEGDIVIDRSLFAPVPGDRYDFDGKGYRTYNVLPDPLLVNLQSAEFTLIPRGDSVQVKIDPPPANLRVQNTVRVTDAACRAGLRGVTFTSFDDDPLRIAIGGRLSSRCPPLSVRRALMRPADFAYGTFVSYWRENGGRLDGAMRLGSRPADARLLVTQESESLAEVVRLVNKPSSNAMTRMLALTLALERYGAPATQENGDRAIVEWLNGSGLVMPELVVDNGSGLSRVARISAENFARLLGHAYQSRYYPELAASLPLGGLDGTLRTRFADRALEGRIRLKTGQINGVAGIAGWVTSRSGRPLTIVVLVNHPGAQYGTGQAVIDTVVRWALDRP
ncbi:MAG: D-alanyl-D-alanine carboxypeptidase/D-alanyl-D-alanine-endopeptidase [Pseudomonadota bacterium]